MPLCMRYFWHVGRGNHIYDMRRDRPLKWTSSVSEGHAGHQVLGTKSLQYTWLGNISLWWMPVGTGFARVGAYAIHTPAISCQLTLQVGYWRWWWQGLILLQHAVDLLHLKTNPLLPLGSCQKGKNGTIWDCGCNWLTPLHPRLFQPLGVTFSVCNWNWTPQFTIFSFLTASKQDPFLIAWCPCQVRRIGWQFHILRLGPWAGAVRMHFWKAHNAFLQFNPRAFAVKMQNHPRRHRLQTTANVRQLTNVMEWWETFSSATNNQCKNDFKWKKCWKIHIKFLQSDPRKHCLQTITDVDKCNGGMRNLFQCNQQHNRVLH